MSTDPRIDGYIAQAAPFAQPILKYLRALVARALPEAEETIKWSMPHWMLGGKNIAGMASFKTHCAFMIHGDGRQGDAMGHYGKLASLADLPSDADLVARLHDARDRLAAGQPRKAKSAPKPEIAMPDDFATALAEGAAKENFERFAPSHCREYLEWITTAKAEATRARRIAQAVEWIAEGKKRNWKYENC
ncbi:MAG: YdeI/OmpD-associated family protein [Novosphingobium sp.]|nr:YdeI/OmpD-associated family protein [Novosphingobium sp.]